MLNNIRYVTAEDRDPINSHANASFVAVSTLLLAPERGSDLQFCQYEIIKMKFVLSYFIH